MIYIYYLISSIMLIKCILLFLVLYMLLLKKNKVFKLNGYISNLLCVYNFKYVNNINKYGQEKIKELNKIITNVKNDLSKKLHRIDYLEFVLYHRESNPSNIGGITLPPLDLTSSNIFFSKKEH